VSSRADLKVGATFIVCVCKLPQRAVKVNKTSPSYRRVCVSAYCPPAEHHRFVRIAEV